MSLNQRLSAVGFKDAASGAIGRAPRRPIQPRGSCNFTALGADASCGALRGLFYEAWPGRNKNWGFESLDKTYFMRACREGGAAIEQALRELDRAFFTILYRDGIRSLRDPDATRDLVQETFIKVWRRCASFRGDSELLRWIKVILRHGAIERLRQTAREVPLEDREGLTEDASRKVYELSVQLNPTPEALASRAEYEVQFRSGWKRFHEEDPLHAGVMTWIVEDGLSNDDIAQLLDRTPGATREFISQCRKRARRYLANWYALAGDQGGPK